MYSDDNFTQDNEERATTGFHLNGRPVNPTTKPVLAAVFGLITIFFTYQVGGSLLTLLIFGLDFENADINIVRLMTIGGQVLLMLAPTLLFTKMVYEDVTTIIRFRLPKLKESILFVIALAVLIPLLYNFQYIQNYIFVKLAEISPILDTVKQLLDELFELINATYIKLLTTENVLELILVIITVSIIPAICEEVFFRGYVQASFELMMKPLSAIIITSIVFGLFHFNPYGLIGLIALSVFFGAALYYSDSIVLPVILHFLNNFFAIMVFHFYGDEAFSEIDPADIGNINEHLISFFLLLLVFSGLIFFIKSQFQRKIIGGEHDLSKV